MRCYSDLHFSTPSNAGIEVWVYYDDVDCPPSGLNLASPCHSVHPAHRRHGRLGHLFLQDGAWNGHAIGQPRRRAPRGRPCTAILYLFQREVSSGALEAPKATNRTIPPFCRLSEACWPHTLHRCRFPSRRPTWRTPRFIRAVPGSACTIERQPMKETRYGYSHRKRGSSIAFAGPPARRAGAFTRQPHDTRTQRLRK